MSDHFEQAMRAAVDPISQELDEIELAIAANEEKLRHLKELRSRAQKVLAALDPERAAPKRKRGAGNGASPISDAQVELILGGVKAMNDPFNAQDVSDHTQIHVTTVHKGLKVLHDRSLIRLDHMGGARNTTKFYALIRGDDG